MTRTRPAAAAAALAVTAGAGVMLFALVARPEPWWQGYVSETGTAGRPYSMVYRLGLIVLALGVALLGGALRRTGPYEPTTPADLTLTLPLGAALGLMMVSSGAAARCWSGSCSWSP
ncbi:hypothetical protein [Paractinoplanes rishiriensis]|uniref:Uncharacterized protein n=1 Tax=Paractinoplanes rishiriensis TaxID=1050105 RepID=A0A919N152_9ACTN|nr:hypothetical protein [Actinoplanes rishiriensis]GIF00551.1 hypothetical protein Ari01nite_80150 [Actinoplanes rishiriensis]